MNDAADEVSRNGDKVVKEAADGVVKGGDEPIGAAVQNPSLIEDEEAPPTSPSTAAVPAAKSAAPSTSFPSTSAVPVAKSAASSTLVPSTSAVPAEKSAAPSTLVQSTSAVPVAKSAALPPSTPSTAAVPAAKSAAPSTSVPSTLAVPAEKSAAPSTSVPSTSAVPVAKSAAPKQKQAESAAKRPRDSTSTEDAAANERVCKQKTVESATKRAEAEAADERRRLQLLGRRAREGCGVNDTFTKILGISDGAVKEEFDRPEIFKILEERFPPGADEKIRAHLQGLLEVPKPVFNSKKEDNMLKDHVAVSYDRGLDKASVSWIASNPLSLQHVSDSLRCILSKDKWNTVLFREDTQARILLQRTEAPPFIGCRAFLKQHVENKEQLLGEVMEAGNLSESEAEDFIRNNLFGDSTIDATTAPALLGRISEEFDRLAHTFANHNDHEWALRLCTENPLLKASISSLDKRVVALVVESKQRQCVEVLYKQLEKERLVRHQGHHCFVLLADSRGIMIRKTGSIQRGLREGFLAQAQEAIHVQRACRVELYVEDSTKAVVRLKDGNCSVEAGPSSIIRVENEAHAQDVIREHFNGRLLWRAVDSTSDKREHFLFKNGIFITGKDIVKRAVMDEIVCLRLQTSKGGVSVGYPPNPTRSEVVALAVMKHSSIEKKDFHKHLKDSSRGHLAFDNGVYSFADGKLLPFSPSYGFTMKIGLPYPHEIDPTVLAELKSKVLMPIFGEEETLRYVLYIYAVALAGDVGHKKFVLCLGHKNGGKSVMGQLLLDSFGSFFVHTFDPNILTFARCAPCLCAVPSYAPFSFLQCTIDWLQFCLAKELYGLTPAWCVCRKRASANDARNEKGLKFMRDNQRSRLLFSNDVNYTKDVKADGILINRLTSGGDQLEVRVLRLHLGKNSFPLSHAMPYTIALAPLFQPKPLYDLP
jgi:hypothetical protein